MGSIYTQMLPKALASGVEPQTLNSEGERRQRLPVWHADGKGRQFPSSPRAPETLGTPLTTPILIVSDYKLGHALLRFRLWNQSSSTYTEQSGRGGGEWVQQWPTLFSMLFW